MTLLLSLIGTASAFASGFLIPEQGAKASSMAGAFTATADDPSAIFFNVAGIAYQRETTMLGGLTIINFNNEFRGDPNDEFSSGATAKYRRHTFIPPNGYGIMPIGENLTVGIGMFSAFGLRTNWEDPWIGRFSSRDANLKTASLQPSIAWKSTSGVVAVGFGAEYRRAHVTLARNIPLSGSGTNPFTGRIIDIAKAHLDSEWGDNWGWNVGVLLKPSEAFRFGASYRAPMDIDLEGDADFTQIPTGNAQIDALVLASLPPDQKISTTIPFPAILAIGVGTSVIPTWDIDFDITHTTWSRFESLSVDFATTPAASFERPQNWDDSLSFRLGANKHATENWDVRLGVLFDQNPQPTEAVSPLLPDADRTGVTFGVGYHHGPWIFDGGLLVLNFADRSTEGRSVELNGDYKTNATLWFTNVGLRF
ncbi:MAG: outer membrane protein transport protein [Thermoanaerobaculia bacterium]|nr:outer membrane protein transport protein [Thermoanaerobaculia bacterium]